MILARDQWFEPTIAHGAHRFNNASGPLPFPLNAWLLQRGENGKVNHYICNPPKVTFTPHETTNQPLSNHYGYRCHTATDQQWKQPLPPTAGEIWPRPLAALGAAPHSRLPSRSDWQRDRLLLLKQWVGWDCASRGLETSQEIYWHPKCTNDQFFHDYCGYVYIKR